MLDCSVVNEVTELGWPVLGCVIGGVVPPFLGVPPVELDHGGCLPPGESFATAEHDHEDEPVEDVLADFATFLSTTNDESEHSPESEDPGGWDEPGDDSVVDLLHDAFLDVGKAPEEGQEAEEDAV